MILPCQVSREVLVGKNFPCVSARAFVNDKHVEEVFAKVGELPYCPSNNSKVRQTIKFGSVSSDDVT